jgi:hypothetical protein
MPSSEVKMPFIKPDMIRKAALYWATLFWMTSQPAATTMMVMKALRMTNSIEMPSTPRW